MNEAAEAGPTRHLLLALPLRLMVLGFVLALTMAGFTSVKLYRMAEIRGVVGDRVHEEHVITSKRVDRAACWVAWDGGRARGWETDAVQIPRRRCPEFKEGDTIQVVRIESNGAVYLEDGIYASNGNFVFDFILLCIEVIAALVLLVLLLRRRGELARPSGR